MRFCTWLHNAALRVNKPGVDCSKIVKSKRFQKSRFPFPASLRSLLRYFLLYSSGKAQRSSTFHRLTLLSTIPSNLHKDTKILPGIANSIFQPLSVCNYMFRVPSGPMPPPRRRRRRRRRKAVPIPENRTTFDTPPTFFSTKEGKLQWSNGHWHRVAHEALYRSRHQIQQPSSSASSSTNIPTLSSWVGNSGRPRSRFDGQFVTDFE